MVRTAVNVRREVQSSPFLTDLDSRAAVKGSRDPLGIQPIWTRLGRYVVGNLTTVSTSVRDFTTLLIGLYFAERVANDTGRDSQLETFLKWEQIAAYARGTVNDDWRFRGTERARRNVASCRTVRVSADRADQILGNQQIYGLWGLYTAPARASELVEGDPPRLTPAAREHVESVLLPIVCEGTGRDARRLRELLALQRPFQLDLERRDRPMLEAVARALNRRLLARERLFYRKHLLHGGPVDSTGGRQAQLAELLTQTFLNNTFAWSLSTVWALANDARAKGASWHPLAHYLDRIRACESVLAPASTLFAHLLGLDGKHVDTIVKRIEPHWGRGLRAVDTDGVREIRGELEAIASGSGDRWVGIADAAAHGHYADLITLLVSQNARVMADRGGAPWIEIRGGRLKVQFRDESGVLPSAGEMSDLWRFSYFVDALRSVAWSLREV